MNLEELQELIKAQGSQNDQSTKIEKYIEDYENLNRRLRQTQIGFTQLDKVIANSDKTTKTVIPVRTAIPFQEEIVEKAVSFEVGGGINLKPNESNGLTEEVQRVIDELRYHSKLIKAKTAQKSLTRSAIQFYIKQTEDGKAIRTKVLDIKKAFFFPVFDDDDMVAFVYDFKTKVNEKEVRYRYIFDKLNQYKLKEKEGEFMEESTTPHGFSVIPIVYLDQAKPDYEKVTQLIDRYETQLSKLGDANDYSGHPILFTTGTIQGMPDKSKSGKHINAEINRDKKTGRTTVAGDAKFLTHDNAPESVKLELETYENLIYRLTSTPKLSFEDLKGLGSTSGTAMELMFLGSILKANNRKGDNQTIVQRSINIIISGITNTTKVALKQLKKDLVYTIDFPSILPNDFAGVVASLSQGVGAGIISKETAISRLALTDNNDEEHERITSVQESGTGEEGI